MNSRLEVSFQLRPGEVTETIEVTGETPLLETESGSLGQVVENRTLVTLPLNGRNYSQLATLAPGVTPNAGSRATDGFSINGNRTFQNVFLVDGIDNNNYILGVDTNSTQALRPSVDAIQEFKLETANYSAEFGRAAGGVISVSIKSGTNNFRGSVFEFLRNEKLDANDFFPIALVSAALPCAGIKPVERWAARLFATGRSSSPATRALLSGKHSLKQQPCLWAAWRGETLATFASSIR